MMQIFSSRNARFVDLCVKHLSERFKANYVFRVVDVDDDKTIRAELKPGKKLTASQANISAVLIPEAASAFYVGYLAGVEDGRGGV